MSPIWRFIFRPSGRCAPHTFHYGTSKAYRPLDFISIYHPIRRQTLCFFRHGNVVQINSALSPSTIFSIATAVAIPAYVLLIGFPKLKLTGKVVSSPAILLTGTAAYLGLLLTWCSQDLAVHILNALRHSLPLPKVEFFAALFEQPQLTCLIWIHLLTLDFFQAR
eukprot:jgi/Botrbrau1/3304/Bobra.0048s0002.2